MLGATNYILYAYPHGGFDYAASCQLNFICVDDAARGQGIAGQLLARLEDDLKSYAKAQAPQRPQAAFITCEQNDPALMTPQQLADDEAASGIDAQARLAWWVRQDFHRLDFRYRQPPLNPGQEPCDYLNYYVHFVQDGAGPASPARRAAEGPSAPLLLCQRRQAGSGHGRQPAMARTARPAGRVAGSRCDKALLPARKPFLCGYNNIFISSLTLPAGWVLILPVVVPLLALGGG